jgi:hypothetical protein
MAFSWQIGQAEANRRQGVRVLPVPPTPTTKRHVRGESPTKQDTDLLRIAHQWQNENHPFRGVIFAHQKGSSIGRCTADLELMARCCDEGELVNRVLFLPLP